MNKEQYKHLIETLWNQLAAREEIGNLDKIAELSQIGIDEIKATFPSSDKIVLALIEDVWAKLSLPNKSDKLTPRDQVFDVTMIAFDAVVPYRLGIKKLVHNNLLTPSTYLDVLPRLNRFGSDLIAPYYKVDGLFGAGAVLAFNGAFAATFWTFLDDETFDLSKTMSTLDSSLKTVFSMLSYCPGIGNIE